MNKTVLLFLIILIEGYVVLASELLTIRQLIPFVGSGPEIISIVISAVLLPLAFGYYQGGRSYGSNLATASRAGKRFSSPRELLLRNILTALCFLCLGLSWVFANIFFIFLVHFGIRQRLIQTTIYSTVFLVTPIFLLGQTLPLVSNYFSSKKLSEITGKMLFFSTTGSFLGSVFSTIVLMSTIGVHYTVIVTLGLLTLLAVILEKRRQHSMKLWAILVFVIVCFLNSGDAMRLTHVVSDNAFSLITVVDQPRRRLMYVNIGGSNPGASAILSKDDALGIPAITYIQSTFIDTLRGSAPKDEKTAPNMVGPRDILIIGAGGFILGLNDTYNNYTYVDIDKDIKEVVEKSFLKEKLSPNKTFAPISARAFLHTNTNKYDLIEIDAYTNTYSVAMEATTQEFLAEAKQALKENGVLLADVYSSPNYQDKFSIRYNNTFGSVFPGYTRQIIGKYDPWRTGLGSQYENVLYVYFNTPNAEDGGIYTDNLDTYSLDLGH